MKAIDTQYAGCLFRSRLEARWAVFFDALGEPWEYEKEGFELPSGRYLPDFWLPRLDCWLEIKGEHPNGPELNLCGDLADATGKPVAIAWGLPVIHFSFDSLDHDICRILFCCEVIPVGGTPVGTHWNRVCFVMDWHDKLCIYSPSIDDDWKPIYPGSGEKFEAFKNPFQVSGPLWEEHVNAAKSARFEFGQTPVARR